MSLLSGRERKPPLVVEPGCCTACAMCLRVCREGAVARDGDIFRIDSEKCTGCADCARICPAGCIGEARPGA